MKKILILLLILLVMAEYTQAEDGITKQSAKSLAKFSVDALEEIYISRGDYASVEVVRQYRNKLENCFSVEFWENRKVLTYGSPKQQNQAAVEINTKCAFEAAQKAREDGLFDKFQKK
ncbi:MAG: hypothetical protein U5J62_09195 [Desulfurivibrio sp.]|nr:hypothetical protein [Desulfurivibrio sp.]